MSEKPSILFVDDEKRILTSLRVIFRSEYQVFLANSGAEALEIVQREKLHAVISDQRMPEMLGHELLREVKKRSPNTMRLLLTGYSDLSAIVSSINDGEVFRYIHKPWNVDEIRSIVASAVQIASNTMGKLNHDDAPQESSASDGSVLVLDDETTTFDQLRALYPDGPAIHKAHDVDEALTVLAGQEVAVLVTDVSVGGQDTTDFVKLLKQQYPLVMTIMLTGSVDADSAIELINQGQVYRYLSKPVGDNVLNLSVQHGLRFYAKNKANPELLQRQQVEAFEPANNPSLAEKVAGRLQALRQRFSFRFG